jgi:hypothetical protein
MTDLPIDKFLHPFRVPGTSESLPRAALRLPWAGFLQAFGLKTDALLRLPWAGFLQAFGLKTKAS